MLHLLLFTMLLPANVSAPADTTIFHSFPSESKLEFQPLFKLKKPMARRLALSDTSIYIWNYHGAEDYYFYRYTFSGVPLPPAAIKGGTGYGQISGGMSGGIRNQVLWTHDLVQNKLVTVQNGVLHDYHIPFSFYSVTLVDGTTLLGTGVNASAAKVELLDVASGQVLQRYGDYGTPPKGIPFGSWKQAFEGTLYLHNTGNKVVLAYRFTDAIEIFDLTTQTSKLIRGPENYDVAFKPLKVAGVDMMERVPKTRFAFMSGYVTDRFIYLLYSGQQHETQQHSAAKYIHVYDWNGKPVTKYLLNRYIMSMAVSADNKWLYAYDADAGVMLKTAIQPK